MSRIPNRGSWLAEDQPRQQLMVLSGLAGGWHEVRELLEQAQRRLGADEASLLLLDTSGTMLVPVVALGLDRPGHRGFGCRSVPGLPAGSQRPASR